MKDPSIRKVQDIINDAQHISAGLSDGRYVPARSEGFHSWRYRLQATWLVFTGKADAVLYEGQ